MSANSVISFSRVEIVIEENFDFPDVSGNDHRSLPSTTSFSAFLNDNHSIDLEFCRSIGEIEIVIYQNGLVVSSFSENVTSPMLKRIQLQQNLSGDFLLQIRGTAGGYALGRFVIR